MREKEEEKEEEKEWLHSIKISSYRFRLTAFRSGVSGFGNFEFLSYHVSSTTFSVVILGGYPS